MNIKYERNLNKSYLVVSLKDDTVNKFEYEMLKQGNIEEFLDVFRMEEDGCSSYYYDISSKQSLDVYFTKKPPNRDFTKKLITQIRQAQEIAGDYLLGSNSLMLSPDMIFVDREDNLKFLCIPNAADDITISFRNLIEQMLPMADNKNRDEATYLYNIYQKTLEDNYTLCDLDCEEHKTLYSQDENIYLGDIDLTDDLKEPPIDCIKDDILAVSKDKVSEKKHKIKKVKRSDENIKPVNEDKKSIMQLSIKDIGSWIMGKDVKNSKSGNNESCVYEPLSYEERERIISVDKAYETSYGNITHPTVCINVGAGKCCGKFYYQGSANEPDFFVDKSPMYIGKDPTKTDICLSTDTVSRLHAKLVREDGDFYIEDLNSTNGTYVNDEMLVYKSKVKLCAGDDIRFGAVRYSFY